MRNLLKITGIFALMALTACTTLDGEHAKVVQKSSDHYQDAKSLPPLKLPSGISGKEINSLYPVPSDKYTGKVKQPSLMPPGIEQ